MAGTAFNGLPAAKLLLRKHPSYLTVPRPEPASTQGYRPELRWISYASHKARVSRVRRLRSSFRIKPALVVCGVEIGTLLFAVLELRVS